VISGHSHKPHAEFRRGVLYLFEDKRRSYGE
jgi:predicted phosphodiesterase